jgi:chemotaxis protein CheD
LLIISFRLQPRKTAASTVLNSINELLKFNTSLSATTQIEVMPLTTETQANPTLEKVRVNMAEMKAENKPIELVTSVGSCVAVCLHDAANMCGGLAHIMLPSSSIAPLESLPAKFADTAVPALAKAVRKLSGIESHLSAKIAGGANMFPNMNALDIGAKNIQAVKATLADHKIRLVAEDVGGSHGRKVTFDIATGVTTVRRFNGEFTKL